MDTCDCVIASERIVVPETVLVPETVFIGTTTVAKEDVTVPIEIKKAPAYTPDIKWGNLDICPANEIWCVITDEKPITYSTPFVQLGIFYSSYQVDWGDGETYNSPTRPNTTENCSHKYNIESGRIDSRGRRFWVMKIHLDNENTEFISLNGYQYSPYKIAYNISPIKYLVIGPNVDAKNSFSFIDSTPHIEAIKYCGRDRHIENFPSFPYGKCCKLKHLIVDGILYIENLTGYRFRNSRISDLSMVSVEGGTLGEYIWGCENFTEGIADLSKMTFGNLSHCFYSIGGSIEEVILPQVPYNGKTMQNCFLSCKNLKRVKLPPSMPYIEECGGAFNDCYSLFEFDIPPDFGSLGDGIKFGANYILKRLDLNIPNTKIRGLECMGIAKGCVGGLVGLHFSKESQFDTPISGAHLRLNNAPLEYIAIIDIFEQLPDFTGQTQRIINITGCPGTPDLTEDDIKVATDKNWQVIGA